MLSKKSEGRLAIRPAVSASLHDDGIVLFHSRRGRLFASNRTGARIWQCLERQMSSDDIALEISRQYAIAEATAREHTNRFLAELRRHELIEG